MLPLKILIALVAEERKKKEEKEYPFFRQQSKRECVGWGYKIFECMLWAGGEGERWSVMDLFFKAFRFILK